MAIVALIAAGKVARILARSDDAVVAGLTAPRNGRMIHIGDRAPRGCSVAVQTKLGRGNVIGWFDRCAAESDTGMTTHTVRTGCLKRAT